MEQTAYCSLLLLSKMNLLRWASFWEKGDAKEKLPVPETTARAVFSISDEPVFRQLRGELFP